MFDNVNKTPSNSKNQAQDPQVKPNTTSASPPSGLPTGAEGNVPPAPPKSPGFSPQNIPTQKPSEVEDMLEGTDSHSSPASRHEPPAPPPPPAFQEAPPVLEPDTKSNEERKALGQKFNAPSASHSGESGFDLPPLTPGAPPPIPPEDLAFTNDNLAGKKKMLLIGIVIVVLLLLGVGGYLIYQNLLTKPQVELTTEPAKTEQPADNTVAPEDKTDGQIYSEEDEIINELPADTDGDGLTDEEEAQYNTDPSLADTDQDGLFDREEIVTWKTDPLNADTDGDSYLDGEEVKNGFDPLGPGKLDYYPFVE